MFCFFKLMNNFLLVLAYLTFWCDWLCLSAYLCELSLLIKITFFFCFCLIYQLFFFLNKNLIVSDDPRHIKNITLNLFLLVKRKLSFRYCPTLTFTANHLFGLEGFKILERIKEKSSKKQRENFFDLLWVYA